MKLTCNETYSFCRKKQIKRENDKQSPWEVSVYPLDVATQIFLVRKRNKISANSNGTSVEPLLLISTHVYVSLVHKKGPDTNWPPEEELLISYIRLNNIIDTIRNGTE